MAEMLPNTRTALGQSDGEPMAPPQLPAPPTIQQHLCHPPHETLPAATAHGNPLHAPRPIGDVPPRTHVPLNTASALRASHVPAANNSQLTRRDRHMFSTLDDSARMKQIMACHAPDGRDFDVKPLVIIVENIMHRARPAFPTIGGEHQAYTWDNKGIHRGFSDVLERLAYPINKTSSEIICKCSAGGDAHSITMALFQSLSSYSWEAKVSICFAAFAVSYGEFWLVAQLYPTTPLAKSVALLMDLPGIMGDPKALKQKFEAVDNLIKAMLEVTHCIVKFKELPAQYISHDSPEMVTVVAHIPTAVYWTIRSIVACSSILMNLIAMGHEYITSAAEAWELTSLAHKLANIKEYLERQIHICNQIIEQKRQYDAYFSHVGTIREPPS